MVNPIKLLQCTLLHFLLVTVVSEGVGGIEREEGDMEGKDEGRGTALDKYREGGRE